ncbi:MAG: hypothetical protein IJ115_05135 [Erysipelotrichaceae bacterium]|nr:hypothetical protein [Erysipelotrichaceae bacterium]
MSDFSLKYYQNAYLKEYESTVVSCVENKGLFEVVLDDTIFYPEGGGQSSDLGYLDDSKVVDVKEVNDRVVHYCKKPLEAGKKVIGKIDWSRRFDNMQNHTGEHIVSGLIHKLFGYENVGFHMGEVIQIDFNGPLTDEQVREVERLANDTIEANAKVVSLYPDAEELKNIDYRSKKELKGQVRLVEVPEADVCACCGTHVNRTGEVGYIKILSCEKHKNGVRIQMLSGNKARKYMNEVYRENLAISNMLSAPMLNTSEYVRYLQERNGQLLSELNQFKEKYLYSLMAEIENGQKLCLQFIKGFDRISYTKYANSLLESGKGKVVGILNENANGYEYLFISREINLREHVKAINERLNGRGGGKDNIIQGSLKSSEEEIRKVLAEVFG